MTNHDSGFLKSLGTGPIIVHSDIFGAINLVPKIKDPQKLLYMHLQQIYKLSEARPIWFPAFNYDFARTGYTHLKYDPVQVGVLNEFYRNNYAKWRTPVPIFSFCGEGKQPIDTVKISIDPFDSDSVFGKIFDQDGTILFYGAPFSATIIHYVERIFGPPLYRYDKKFPGRLIMLNGRELAVTLLYHVRPWGKGLDYAWGKLFQDLRKHDALRHINTFGRLLTAVHCRALVQIWGENFRNDPLYLLDETSRRWVEPMLEKLGRRFRLENFE